MEAVDRALDASLDLVGVAADQSGTSSSERPTA